MPGVARSRSQHTRGAGEIAQRKCVAGWVRTRDLGSGTMLEGIVACIPPTLEGWVYIIPIHGALDGPLYTWAQYTPTNNIKM